MLKKGELQDRLREVILCNVPSGGTGNEAHCHESMSGLDVTVWWVLLFC
jgi:hypothetical protein